MPRLSSVQPHGIRLSNLNYSAIQTSFTIPISGLTATRCRVSITYPHSYLLKGYFWLIPHSLLS